MRPSDPDVRHELALRLGREFAERVAAGRPLPRRRQPRDPTRAELILARRQQAWPWLEDVWDTAGLTVREQRVLDLAYDLKPGETHGRLTHETIAAQLGVHRSRVGQIAAAAIRKLDTALTVADNRPGATR